MDTNVMEKNRKTCPASCDIYEASGKIILEMEMPGVEKENLDIRVDNDRLIISGKKQITAPAGEYRIKEIREGDYHQAFTLDDTIDRNKIEAVVKNGIVTLSMGIKESEKPRKISITAK